ncbi:MAG: sel1 repeat family protein, partial [Acidimicrobiaceae bacterium]|nr:sel1 repeat family protein [Acidimicrobiaceae bacterium]
NLGVLRFEAERTVGHDSAVYWWDNAARVGHDDAMVNLGFIRQSQGRLSGPESAEYWWQRAAEAGNLDAKHNLDELQSELRAAASGEVIVDLSLTNDSKG